MLLRTSEVFENTDIVVFICTHSPNSEGSDDHRRRSSSSLDAQGDDHYQSWRGESLSILHSPAGSQLSFHSLHDMPSSCVMWIRETLMNCHIEASYGKDVACTTFGIIHCGQGSTAITSKSEHEQKSTRCGHSSGRTCEKIGMPQSGHILYQSNDKRCKSDLARDSDGADRGQRSRRDLRLSAIHIQHVRRSRTPVTPSSPPHSCKNFLDEA